MKAYILSIAGIVLITAVVTVISPSGKMGKFIKGALKLTVLTVLISPFISLFTKGELDFSAAGSKIETDTAYLQTCSERMSERDGKNIVKYIEQEYGAKAEVVFERGAESGFPVKKIQVKIVDFGINGEDEHIDILMKIQAALEQRYGCAAEVS